MNHESRLTAHAGRIAAGTTVSRILGYLRDMLVAHLFGAGLAADAFYAAYRIPNLLRRLLGEGSLSASFIPVLSEYLHNKTKEETQALIDTVFTVLTVVLIVLTALGMIFSRQLVGLIAYGFANDPDKLALTTSLTRLMFPFLLFVCLAALCLGILNTLSAFFMPAIAPATLSVAEIGYVLALAPLMSPDNQVKGLAISVIIGGLAQLLVQIPPIFSRGWKLRWRFNLAHPGLRRIGTLMLPSMIGLSVDQINAFVDTICASFLAQGSITALYYSNRIMQLPLAIFGLALASVALPAMSRAAAVKDTKAMTQTLNFSVRFIIFILAPAAAGLMVIGFPLIRLLFERGQFNLHASLLTNQALFYYSLGLPSFAIAKVLASAFYALQETKTPVRIAVVALIMNAILNITLMRFMGVGGLALATSISSVFNAAALAVVLRKRIGPLGIKRIASTAGKALAASAVMACISGWLAYRAFPGMRAVGTLSALIAGSASYLLLAFVLKMEERRPLFALILREKPSGQD